MDRPEPALKTSLPWHCRIALLGGALIAVGVLWDISWHSTIGRDTFWTPAHLAIYLGGSLPGLASGWVALKATFLGRPEEREASVRLWGARAPLGAWVTIWGAIAMLTSAPFDDWWHSAYGLDVQILSLPHSVLALGIFAVILGGVLSNLAFENRESTKAADGLAPPRSGLAFAFSAGLILTVVTIWVTEYSLPHFQRTGNFHSLSLGIYPAILVAAACASPGRWAATGAAAIYSAVLLAMVWILPLFPAQPLLAPIYNPVDRMAPPAFPLLLVLPALAVDLILRRQSKRSLRAALVLPLILGTAFAAVFVAVQWHFAAFLISPAADNWFFAGNRFWTYADPPGEWRQRFLGQSADPLTASGLARAWVHSVLSSGAGIAAGRWMRRLER